MDAILLKKCMDWFEYLPKKNYRTKRGWAIITFGLFISIFLIFKPLLNSAFTIDKQKLTCYLLYFSIFIMLLWTIVWIEIRDILKKNKSNKPGIGFFVNSTIINGNDLEKEHFIRVLVQQLEHKYNVLFYDKYEYDILQKKSIDNTKQMKFLNLQIQLIIEEENGNSNGENSYNFSLKKTIFLFDNKVNSMLTKPNLQDMQHDFNFLSKRNFCITNGNNLSDSKNVAKILKVSISYLYSSILCHTYNTELALKELKEIEETLSNEEIPDDIRSHLMLGINKNCTICFDNMIYILLKDEFYFLDKEKINNIMIINEKLLKCAISGRKNSPVTSPNGHYYNSIIEVYKSVKSMCLYDLGETQEALNITHTLDWTQKDNLNSNLLNKAFLLIMNNEYEKGFKTYSKARKKIDCNSEYEKKSLQKILTFIENRKTIALDKNLELCSAIMKFYFLNDQHAEKTLAHLADGDKSIKCAFLNMI